MSEAVLYLAVAYAAIGVVVLGLNLYSRWPLWVKLITIMVVSLFYFVTWQALQGLLGWPARDAMPERFILLASSVHEPDQTTGTAGVIHLWVTPIRQDQPAQEPRAFALPYSKPLHREIQDAKKQMRNGIMQLGQAKPAASDPQRATDLSRFSRRAQTVTIEDLPDPALPEK